MLHHECQPRGLWVQQHHHVPWGFLWRIHRVVTFLKYETNVEKAKKKKNSSPVSTALWKGCPQPWIVCHWGKVNWQHSLLLSCLVLTFSWCQEILPSKLWSLTFKLKHISSVRRERSWSPSSARWTFQPFLQRQWSCFIDSYNQKGLCSHPILSLPLDKTPL